MQQIVHEIFGNLDGAVGGMYVPDFHDRRSAFMLVLLKENRQMIARTGMRVAIGATMVVTLSDALDAIPPRQTPIAQPADEKALRE